MEDVKAIELEAGIASGFVLEHPICECRWEGKKPAVLGAGCPGCGARIGSANLAELVRRAGELELENETLRARLAELEQEILECVEGNTKLVQKIDELEAANDGAKAKGKGKKAEG